MKRLLLLLSIVLLSSGCGRAKRAAGDAASAAADATKAVAGKAGHAVGEHVGTFFAAVGEGVEQSVCDYAENAETAEPEPRAEPVEGAAVTRPLRSDISANTGGQNLNFLSKTGKLSLII